jgi:hypothetical protein
MLGVVHVARAVLEPQDVARLRDGPYSVSWPGIFAAQAGAYRWRARPYPDEPTHWLSVTAGELRNAEVEPFVAVNLTKPTTSSALPAGPPPNGGARAPPRR